MPAQKTSRTDTSDKSVSDTTQNPDHGNKSETSKSENTRNISSRSTMNSLKSNKPDTSRTEHGKIDTSKTVNESGKADSNKPENGKTDTSKKITGNGKIDTSRTESSKIDTSRSEKSQKGKISTDRVENTKVETSKSETVKKETPRNEKENRRSENGKIDTSRSGISKQDTSRKENGKIDSSGKDNGKSNTNEKENSKPNTSRTENSKIDTSRSEIGKTDKSGKENSKPNTSKTENSKTGNIPSVTKKTNDNKTEDGSTNMGKGNLNKSENGKLTVDTSRSESKAPVTNRTGKSESNGSDTNRSDKSKIDTGRTNKSEIENRPKETNRNEPKKPETVGKETNKTEQSKTATSENSPRKTDLIIAKSNRRKESIRTESRATANSERESNRAESRLTNISNIDTSRTRAESRQTNISNADKKESNRAESRQTNISSMDNSKTRVESRQTNISNIDTSRTGDSGVDTGGADTFRTDSSRMDTSRTDSTDASGDDLSRQPGMLADVRAGLQRAYLEGIEFMRLKVKETEEELSQIKLGFYQTEVAEDEEYEKYLVKCNDHFLKANNELRRKNVKLKVIDSEMDIVSLLNELREKLEVDKGEIAFISEFWENLKSTMESLRVLVNKFRTSVVERLRGNCISYNNTDIHLDVSVRYTEEVKQYLTDLERTLSDTQNLVISYANAIQQDLFSHTKFTEGILIACDLKAFPILRLFPDLTEKIESMCDTAFMWLDRDERYMYEIHDYIRETRTMAKKRVEVLKVQKEKMKKFEKAVKSANIMLHNNKEKLENLESDLNQLEETFSVYKQQMDLKHGEKSQKESMVDFLKITLSQTKKNYNLQLKRQRLLKQVVELEGFLQGLERDLVSVQGKIQQKAQQKDMLAVKLETSEKSYGALKTDLDQFTDNLSTLEQEVNGLSGQLLQLEIIQTYKSSPENIDGVYDRPQSVKLAPSLKEKIKRKRKIMPPVH